MKRNGWVFVLSLLLCIGLGAPVWAQQSQGGATKKAYAQDSGGQKMGGMHHGMMGKMHGKGGMQCGMHGCPMAMGGGECPMAMGGRCPKGNGWMGSFHQWMKNFMIHANLFNLSDKQMQELETKFADSYKKAIRTKADIKTMQVDLMEEIRNEPLQLKQVRSTMNKMAEKKVDMKMNFLELYSQIMQMLNPNQKQKVEETIGSPFPMPWEHAASMGEGGEMQGHSGSSD